MLGAGPRPYSTLIPSKDHKDAYKEILAWLMRGCWVIQLRSFAWVRVSGEVKRRVAADMKREADGEKSDGESEDGAGPKVVVDGTGGGEAGQHDLPSGYLTPNESSIHSLASVDSSSTTRTAIPFNGLPSDMTRDRDVINPESLTPRPTLILNPSRASGIESRYLSAIADHLEEEDGKDVRDAWDGCLKYFNGEHALEKIAAREGWKRRKVEALRLRWRARGVLLEVKHW